MRTLLARAEVGAVLALVIGGCGGSGPVGLGGGSSTNGQQLYETEYDLALKRWQANAPTHYEIV
jgi:hypothetical protein